MARFKHHSKSTQLKSVFLYLFSFFTPWLRASAFAPALLYHNTSMYLSVLRFLTLGCRKKPHHQANSKTVPIHIKAASPAAYVAGTIWVLTWSIKSVPVVIELNMVVSEIGEH